MKIPSISSTYDWWKTEVFDHPQNHIGPGCVMLATTILVEYVWGKYHVIGFVCMAVATYPFANYQLDTLMYLDVHETAYAVAVVGIQIFCMKFPLFSQWGLPMSVALAYSFTIRGIKIRQKLGEQNSQISTLNVSNKKLKEQVDSLSTSAKELKATLIKLETQVLKKGKLAQEKQAFEEKKADTIIDIEIDYLALNKQLQEMTESCNRLIEEKGVKEQLLKMDEQAEEISKQNALIKTQSEKLQKITATLQEANKQFQDLLERAEKDEQQLKSGLQQIHSWLQSLR